MKKDEIVGLINDEIAWCNANPMPEKISPEFRDGFIKGLIQARNLIESFYRKLNEKIPESDDYRSEIKWV